MHLSVRLTLIIVLTLLAAPVGAQQTATSLPQVVQVQGLGEVIDALERVERKLDRLLSSRWEYLFVQRNRLENISNRVKLLGQEGWELVTITVEEGFVFKRRVVAR